MQRVTGRRGRVTVWRADLGQRGVGVLAYTPMATDERGFGDTGVIATVAGVPGEGADLWAWAGLHNTSGAEETLARWLLCAGWSARLTAAPGNRDLPDAEWSADLERTVRLEKSGYGHEALSLGRLVFPDAGVRAVVTDVLSVRRR